MVSNLCTWATDFMKNTNFTLKTNYENMLQMKEIQMKNSWFIIGSEPPPQFVKVHGKMIKHHSAFIIDSHFAEAFYLSVFRTGQRERERVFVRWPISICKSWFAKLLFRDLSCRPYSNSVITDNGFTQKEKKLEVKKNYFHLII